jgi:hypothetical protein
METTAIIQFPSLEGLEAEGVLAAWQNMAGVEGVEGTTAAAEGVAHQTALGVAAVRMVT